MMLRCFIIDDEPHAVAKMEQFVNQTPFLQLVASYTNVLEAISPLQNDMADLLFLDIHMPELSGMDVLKMLQNKNVMVVLTTGYSEYAIESFEYSAIGYLLKPITYPRFLKAAQKAMEHHKSIHPTAVATKMDKDFIFIKGEHKGRQVKINFQDIDYVEGEKNYIRFHCTAEKFMLMMTMKEVETLLPPHLFIRVHNSFIISVKKIIAIEGNAVVLNINNKARKDIPIGATFKGQFLERIAM